MSIGRLAALVLTFAATLAMSIPRAPVRLGIGIHQVPNEEGVLFTEPMPGYVPSTCKFDVDCFAGLLHAGTDYFADPGTAVLAIAPGQVVLTSDNGTPECCTIKDGNCAPRGECSDHGLGRVVILSHLRADDNTTVYSLYAHLSEISAQAVSAKEIGECIPQGFRLGTVGASGYGFEDYWTRVVTNRRPHLHLEIKQRPILSNPIKTPTYYGYVPKSEEDRNLRNWGYYPPETFIGRVRAKPCPSLQLPIPVPTLGTPVLPVDPGSVLRDIERALQDMWERVSKELQGIIEAFQKDLENWLKEQGQKLARAAEEELLRFIQSLCAGGSALVLSPVALAWKRRRRKPKLHQQLKQWAARIRDRDVKID